MKVFYHVRKINRRVEVAERKEDHERVLFLIMGSVTSDLGAYGNDPVQSGNDNGVNISVRSKGRQEEMGARHRRRKWSQLGRRES